MESVIRTTTHEDDDGYCIHGIHEDDHHGCAECAMERAEAMRDLQREGG